MTSEKRPQTRLTGTASQFAVYVEMTAARSRGAFSFDPNTCGDIENARHRHGQGLRALQSSLTLQGRMARISIASLFRPLGTQRSVRS